MSDNKAVEADGLRLKNMEKTNKGAQLVAGPANVPSITQLSGWRTEQETETEQLQQRQPPTMPQPHPISDHPGLTPRRAGLDLGDFNYQPPSTPCLPPHRLA